jgi:hypothetical protein
MDEESAGIEIYIGDQLCSITLAFDSYGIQTHKCHMLYGNKITFKRTNAFRSLKLCGVRVKGKTTTTCDERKPDYSSIACMIAGRVDLKISKKSHSTP